MKPRPLAGRKRGPMSDQPRVEGHFHKGSSTICYIVHDPETMVGAIIDPVLDYDASSGRASTEFADAVADRVEALGLKIAWVLETHVREQLGALADLRVTVE